MDDLVLARAIHVTAVVFWIGGVGFVTWVVMPALRASERPARDQLTIPAQAAAPEPGGWTCVRWTRSRVKSWTAKADM